MIHSLFDKSFLQSLSVDESVWFDHFYKPVVCPIFFVETLADLAHDRLKDRTPERAVQIIADKFPDQTGVPCTDHLTMIEGDLLGYSVPMDGRIPLSGGRTVRSAGKVGTVFEESPEAIAFGRWQRGEFSTVERTYAADLRKSLGELDLAKLAGSLQSLGITGSTVRSLEDAKALTHSLISGYSKRSERLYLTLQAFSIPPETGFHVSQRWERAGRPPLDEFAPYAAYALSVELFFHVALGAGLISSTKNSNRTDIAYLYYLPFCHAFVSSDRRTHKNCAWLFLRPNQRFIWGPDLKTDLTRLNEYFLKFPETERERGIMRLADKPPKDGGYLTSEIYDWFDEKWREDRVIERMPLETEKRIVQEAQELRESTDRLPPGISFNLDEVDSISVPHLVRKRKGSWWQLPKDLEVPPEAMRD